MVKTEVSFVDGFDDVRCQPDYAKSAGLNRRFAIIQETYRPDCVDVYFDEPLWLSLLEFAKRTSTNVQIGVTQNSSKKVALENFLADFSKLPNEERHPPPFIFGSEEGMLKIAIETEYWNNVGGPMPYHDSYTYSIYSSDPVGKRVLQHLAAANAGSWDLASEPMIGVVTRKKWWRRVW
jgi:hypothetical protein